MLSFGIMRLTLAAAKFVTRTLIELELSDILTQGREGPTAKQYGISSRRPFGQDTRPALADPRPFALPCINCDGPPKVSE